MAQEEHSIAGIATLADGENVEQTFNNCQINVVSGNQNMRDGWLGSHNKADTLNGSNHGIVQTDSIASQNAANCTKGHTEFASNETSGIGHPYDTSKIPRSPCRESPPKIKDKYVQRFLHKVNAYTQRNVDGSVMEDYKQLSDPDDEFYPQMRVGFELFQGGYVPQDGFSAHGRGNIGRVMTVSECIEAIQRRGSRPCVVIGQPGSGKTVLMKRFAKRVMQDNELQQQHKPLHLIRKMMEKLFHTNYFDAVFHINIRDIPYLEDSTLASIIFDEAVTGITPKESRHGLQAILKNKLKSIMFFDGLDQASWEPRSDRKVGPWTKSNTPAVFGNILTGHLLPNVPVVFSSREHSIACLSKEMRPDFVAALVGFSSTDAKSMYCQIMGEGAAADWDAMKSLNPGMHYMCLTPLFLIFYMITKRNDPTDPPVCASDVMVRIIQILLESDHMRNASDMVEVINKLKQMAFRGTREQRVVFTNSDLNKFGIDYNVVSDVIIKVAGLNILAQKILEGMYRFFFSHQTLQEILTALCVMELSLEDFKNLVDEEFHKPDWSVVRNFVCGMLKNPRVNRRINRNILKQDDFEEKGKYLFDALENQLRSNPSPKEQLDIFIALKEADEMEILRSHASHLNFTRSPLSPVMINILCSVMKHLGHIPSLSFAYSSMDKALLEVFARDTESLGIKIDELDLRGVINHEHFDLWRRIFENLTISTCLMDLTGDKQETDPALLMDIVEATRNNVSRCNFGDLNMIQLSIDQLEMLSTSNSRLEIRELWIISNSNSFSVDLWQQAFQRMSFSVNICWIDAPKSDKGKADVRAWLKAADIANTRRVNKIHLKSHRSNFLRMSDIMMLNESGFQGKIVECWVQPDRDVFDVATWRQTFQQMSFTIDRCWIEYSKTLNNWLDAAVAARVENVKEILLSSQTRKITIQEFEKFNFPEFR